MIRSALLALAFVATGSAAAMAQTDAEKAACRSDAIKYCSADVGNPKAMFACLDQHKSEISEACRKVVEAHGG